MNSRQLASVLLKILGISVLLRGVPSFVSDFLIGLLYSAPAKGASTSGRSWAYVVGTAVEVVMAIWLIVKSRKVAEFLFKSEDEQAPEGEPRKEQ